MSCNRYHLWAALDVHAFSKAEAVLRFSAEEDGMWVQWQDYDDLKAEVERLDKQRLKLISICEEAIEWIGVTDFDESPADRLNANLTAICTEKPTK